MPKQDITTLHLVACYLREWIKGRREPRDEYERGYDEALDDMLDEIEVMMGRR